MRCPFDKDNLGARDIVLEGVRAPLRLNFGDRRKCVNGSPRLLIIGKIRVRVAADSKQTQRRNRYAGVFLLTRKDLVADPWGRFRAGDYAVGIRGKGLTQFGFRGFETLDAREARPDARYRPNRAPVSRRCRLALG
jgi:hypothetical protein